MKALVLPFQLQQEEGTVKSRVPLTCLVWWCAQAGPGAAPVSCSGVSWLCPVKGCAQCALSWVRVTTCPPVTSHNIMQRRYNKMTPDSHPNLTNKTVCCLSEIPPIVVSESGDKHRAQQKHGLAAACPHCPPCPGNW